MTTRMVDEEGFKKIGAFLIRARDIATGIQKRQLQTVCCYVLLVFVLLLGVLATNRGNLCDSVLGSTSGIFVGVGVQCPC